MFPVGGALLGKFGLIWVGSSQFPLLGGSSLGGGLVSN